LEREVVRRVGGALAAGRQRPAGAGRGDRPGGLAPALAPPPL